jgi:hypothetical protein
MMTNKRSIPEIRIRLQELAKENAGLDRTNAGWSEVASLAEELHRNTPIGRVKPHSQKATTELSEEIRAYKKKHPEKSQREIAEVFDVNPGRVSEALNNLR